MKDEHINKDKSNVQEVIEERLVVDKRKLETGKVKLTKKVYEEEVPVDLSITQENIDVDIRKIGKVVDAPGEAVRTEGDSTIYSVYKEVLVRQTILEEEIWITRKKSVEKFDRPEILRREEITVERSSKDDRKE